MSKVYRSVIITPFLITVAVGSNFATANAAPPESLIRETEAAFNAAPRPKQYAALINEAKIFLHTNPAKAELLYKQAIAMKDGFVDPYIAEWRLAEAYLLQKKYRLCANLYEELYRPSQEPGGSERPDMLANWATALLGLGNVRRAAQIANRATAALQTSENRPELPLFPETETMPYTPSEVKAVIALVHGIQSSRMNYETEGYAATLAYFTDAARLAPRMASAHFFVGQTLEYKQRYTEARAEYERAIRYGKDESVRRLAAQSLSKLPISEAVKP